MGEESALTLIILSVAAAYIWALQLRFRKRQLQHQERLAAIEKGVSLPGLDEPADSYRIYLLRGLQWLLGGVGLLVFLAGVSLTVRIPRPLGDRLNAAQRMEQLGATQGQITEELGRRDYDQFPIAFSLFALVPIAIGTAYLVFYRVERAHQTPSSHGTS